LYIRTKIKNLINEEGEKPISDTKITKILNEEGIDIARRTVAKYRSMEGILPTHLRKKEQNR
jgi:RNA polymerase sigma-54 factor